VGEWSVASESSPSEKHGGGDFEQPAAEKTKKGKAGGMVWLSSREKNTERKVRRRGHPNKQKVTGDKPTPGGGRTTDRFMWGINGSTFKNMAGTKGREGRE